MGNPRQCFIESAEDMEWLAEVHSPIAREYKYAIVHGNEDCPEKVFLYARNHYRCKPTVLVADENGDLVVSTWGEKPKE